MKRKMSIIDGAPAIKYNWGAQWFKDGVCFHRIDGPAVDCDDGNKYWHNNGLLHRDDGPAMERSIGYKLWYKGGKPHRVDDEPAVIWADGRLEWYKDGIAYTPNWKDIHTRVAIKVSNLNLPMLILLEIVSRIPYRRKLSDYQVTEIVSKIRN